MARLSLKRAAAFCLVLALAPVTSTASAQSRDAALKGVTKVTVDVILSAKDLPSSIAKDRLQTVVELKLRTAGLRVLSPDEDARDPDVNPSVELNVILINARSGRTQLGHAFSTRLAVRDYSVSRRNTAIVPAELWASAYLNITGTDETATELERTLTMLLDEFLNEWLKANPKPN